MKPIAGLREIADRNWSPAVCRRSKQFDLRSHPTPKYANVRLTDHEELSPETVRRRLAENHLKPWRKDIWCIPKVDGHRLATAPRSGHY